MATSKARKLKDYIESKIQKGHSYIGVPIKNWSSSDILSMQRLAHSHGFPMEWLANLINFESGGTFNPSIQNSIGATGLIQFLPSTAKGLGTSTNQLRQMSVKAQLSYVDKYISRALKNKGVLKSDGMVKDTFTQQDLFMTIFYPVAVGKPSYVFPSHVQRANSGIRTPKDYTDKALRSAPFKGIPSSVTTYKKMFGKIEGGGGLKGGGVLKNILIFGSLSLVVIGSAVALAYYSRAKT